MTEHERLIIVLKRELWKTKIRDMLVDWAESSEVNGSPVVTAIKQLRRNSGLGLRDAKTVIDYAVTHIASPERLDPLPYTFLHAQYCPDNPQLLELAEEIIA